MAFGDRVIIFNNCLFEHDCKKEDGRSKKVGQIPITLKLVANIINQLSLAGSSIAANNAEATNAIGKTDFKSKSIIALKDTREFLYWIELLYRNLFLDNIQDTSMHDEY